MHARNKENLHWSSQEIRRKVCWTVPSMKELSAVRVESEFCFMKRCWLQEDRCQVSQLQQLTGESTQPHLLPHTTHSRETAEQAITIMPEITKTQKNKILKKERVTLTSFTFSLKLLPLVVNSGAGVGYSFWLFDSLSTNTQRRKEGVLFHTLNSCSNEKYCKENCIFIDNINL